ncbi:hypothetical protein FB645_004658 [Coemansia sp. IMI 203386]|nr:hypothetical protein FB645_004658 [Coemansia sp. IMI 203386]
MTRLFSNTDSVSISIEPDTPAVHLFGERDGSAGCILSGYVKLVLQRPTKTKSLSVTFQGMQHLKTPSTSPTDSEFLHTTTRTLVRDTQMLIDLETRYIRLNAGTHRLRFEFIIPGNVPATIHTGCGSNSYTLEAELLQTGLRPRCTTIVKVPILRCPSDGGQWAISTFDMLNAGAQWDARVSVNLSHDICAVSDGETCEFVVTIGASEKNMRLMALDLQLREIQTMFSKPNGSAVVYKQTRMVGQKHRIYGSTGLSIDDQCDYSVRMMVPGAFNGIQYDYECADFMVTHRLVLTVLIRTPDDKNVEITIPAQVAVIPRCGIAESSILPLYESVNDDILLQSAPLPDYVSGMLDCVDNTALLSTYSSTREAVLPAYSD